MQTKEHCYLNRQGSQAPESQCHRISIDQALLGMELRPYMQLGAVQCDLVQCDLVFYGV